MSRATNRDEGNLEGILFNQMFNPVWKRSLVSYRALSAYRHPTFLRDICILIFSFFSLRSSCSSSLIFQKEKRKNISKNKFHKCIPRLSKTEKKFLDTFTLRFFRALLLCRFRVLRNLRILLFYRNSKYIH